MSEPASDPFAEFRAEISNLRGELADLQKAQTPAEQKQARADVADAEADVAAIAKKAGLRPEQIQRALTAARREAFREEHGDEIRAMVSEELDKLMDAAEQKEAEAKAAVEQPEPEQKPKREPKAEVEQPEPEPDAAPERPHWSEKSVSELIR